MDKFLCFLGPCMFTWCDEQHAPSQRPSGLHISRAHTYSETDALWKTKISQGFIFISASD